MKNQVLLKHWLPLHPYTTMQNTDAYYLKICNRVFDVVNQEVFKTVFNKLTDKDELKSVSCFLTSYLEDLASEAGLWRAFTSMHQELYQKQIPFFEETEYYDGEPNIQDIQVLLWYYLNTIQTKTYIDANSPFLYNVSIEVFEIFEEVWEYAPENQLLRKRFSEIDDYHDYYQSRTFITLIQLNSYLFYPDFNRRFWKDLDEEESNPSAMENPELYFLEALDQAIHSVSTKLLAKSSSEWAAAVLGNEHPAYNAFMQMSPRISGLFSFDSETETCLNLKHVASDHVFQVLKSTADWHDDSYLPNNQTYLSIVKWEDMWWYSGTSFVVVKKMKMSLNESVEFNSLKIINRLSPFVEKAREDLKTHHQAFLSLTNKKEYVFLVESELSPFYTRFGLKVNELNGIKQGNMPSPEIKTSASGAGDQGFLVYFNPDAGIELARVADGIAHPENPYYDEDQVYSAWQEILFSTEISAAMTRFCIEHFGDDSGYFDAVPYSYYHYDMDFLLRFFKTRAYASYPRNLSIKQAE